MTQRSKSVSDRPIEREDINRTFAVLDRLIEYLEHEDAMMRSRLGVFDMADYQPSQLLLDAKAERARLFATWVWSVPGERERFRQEHPRNLDLGNSPYCANIECGGEWTRFTGKLSREDHERMWTDASGGLPGDPPRGDST